MEPGWIPQGLRTKPRGWIGVPRPLQLPRRANACVRFIDPETGQERFAQIGCGANGFYFGQILASSREHPLFERWCPVVLDGEYLPCTGDCPGPPGRTPRGGAGAGSTPLDSPPARSAGRVLFVSAGHGGRADRGQVGKPVRVLVDGRRPVDAVRRLSTTVGGPERRCDEARAVKLAAGTHFYTVPGTSEGREFQLGPDECKVFRVGVLQAGPAR